MDGFPIPVWLYGPPGSSKSSMSTNLAQALGVEHYLVSLGPTHTESKIVGYKNLATGQFVPGSLNEPYEKGGFAFLDEIDAADPGVLVGINGLLSGSEYRFPNGEIVQRHPDFYIVAAGNTIGQGAAGGFTRNKLDAAFLDRFVKIEIGYDEGLERVITNNHPWTCYVQKVRRLLKELNSRNVYVTMRHCLNGVSMLQAGLPSKHVTESVLFSGMSVDLQTSIVKQLGSFKS
jgi:midasin (ATPase involved in ribosome maturation)